MGSQGPIMLLFNKQAIQLEAQEERAPAKISPRKEKRKLINALKLSMFGDDIDTSGRKSGDKQRDDPQRTTQ